MKVLVTIDRHDPHGDDLCPAAAGELLLNTNGYGGAVMMSAESGWGTTVALVAEREDLDAEAFRAIAAEAWPKFWPGAGRKAQEVVDAELQAAIVSTLTQADRHPAGTVLRKVEPGILQVVTPRA